MDLFLNNREMVFNYIKKQSSDLRKASYKKIDDIHSMEEWLGRRENIKEKLIKSIGGLPERIPGNAMVMNRIEREGYFLENILLESLPDIYINLNLYVPKKVCFPVPAVVFATGHSSKADPVHQYPVQGLVRNGFVVATFDCLGRGERSKGNEHFEAGPLCWLNGNCMIRYFINDNMKVVDYLITRDEVDKEKIACTGTSGGGNTTIFHTALDERVRCAVPACTTASFTDYIMLEYSGCPEYHPLGLLGEEIDIQDIICLIAPRPLLFIGASGDVINIMESLNATYEHARKVYELYGSSFNISTYIDKEGDHGYNCNMRNVMYQWMKEKLHYRVNSESYNDGFDNPELLESRYVIEFIDREMSNIIQYENNKLTSYKCISVPNERKIKLMHNLGLDNKVIGYREIAGRRCYYEKYIIVDENLIETESGIYIPIVSIWKQKDNNNSRDYKGIAVVLEVEGKDILLKPNGFKHWVEEGYIVTAADLRGTGDSFLKRTLWDHYEYCSAERCVSGAGIVMGYPLIGQRVYDMIACIRYIREKHKVGSEVKVIAKGFGNVIAVVLKEVLPDIIVDLDNKCAKDIYRCLYTGFIKDNSSIPEDFKKCIYNDIFSGNMESCYTNIIPAINKL